MADRIIVTGAGIAGSRKALSLRERGHDGTITLFGDEILAPYDRPPLSNGQLEPGDPVWLAPFDQWPAKKTSF